jgi:hypothetical protein
MAQDALEHPNRDYRRRRQQQHQGAKVEEQPSAEHHGISGPQQEQTAGQSARGMKYAQRSAMTCISLDCQVMPKELRKDLKTLALFIDLYCRYRHVTSDKSPADLKVYDVPGICGREIVVCEACRKLLTHAFVKRAHCPYEPKPACKHCPTHCYHPSYRAQIREVMKVSGRKMLLAGRLDYLFHLLF